MIIVGWKSPDLQGGGHKCWAALWANGDEPDDLEAAVRSAETLNGGIVRTFPDFLPLTTAKEQVLNELRTTKGTGK